MTACCVYAFFAEDERCLYVGMTSNWTQRISRHRHAAWWPEYARVTRTAQMTREDARAEELRLIEELKPVHNLRASRKPRPVRNAEPAHPELIAEIERYCEANGVSETAFGMAATGDLSLVADLRKGRECRRATLRRIDDCLRHSQAVSA
jgi:predicted GIY-YIG superfamily endonuclease